MKKKPGGYDIRSVLIGLIVLIVSCFATSALYAGQLSLLESFTMGSYPEGMAVSSDGTTLYYTITDYDTVTQTSSSSLYAMDLSTGAVTSGPLDLGYGGANYITLIPGTNMAYIVCHYDGVIAVVDLVAMSLVKIIQGGGGPGALTPDGSRYYSPHFGQFSQPGDSPAIHVFDTATHTLLPETISASGSKLTITSDGSQLIAVGWSQGSTGSTAQVVDLASNQVTAQFALNDFNGTANPSGTTLYVNEKSASSGSVKDIVTVYDIASQTQTGTISLPVPDGSSYFSLNTMLVHPDGQLLYASTSEDTILVIDLVSGQVVQTLFLDGAQTFILSSNGNRMYVNISSYDNVSNTSTYGVAVLDTGQSACGVGQQISVISPADNAVVTHASSNGIVPLQFSKVTGAVKYILHFHLFDVVNLQTFELPIEVLWPAAGSSTAPSPGLSETSLGMQYDLAIDAASWNMLAQFDMFWGVEAYDDTGTLLGSTCGAAGPEKYVRHVTFAAGGAVSLKSPSSGAELSTSNPAQVFEWDAFSGAAAYSVVLVHVKANQFADVFTADNLNSPTTTLNAAEWQSFPSGTWYWTVWGIDSTGKNVSPNFTIFKFTAQ